MLMSSGSVNKLPDSLQWQIRTLLPKKDGKVQAGTQLVEPAGEVGNMDVGQQGFPLPQGPSPMTLAAAASMHLPMTSQVCLSNDLQAV